MNMRFRYVFLAVVFFTIVALLYTRPGWEEAGGANGPGGHEAAYGHRSDDLLDKPKPLSADETALMDRIRRLAGEQRIEPIDAKVDPVWKAIPGYNGRELDIQETFSLSKGRDRLQPVYREIEPRVQLEDLGAHPIYKGNPQKPMVSLMVNVAWGNEFLPGILETFREHQVRTTFFLDGTWLSQNADLARQIVEDGHEIGNHGYSHKDMSKLGRSAAHDEISRTDKLIRDVLGVEYTLFAPPSGDYDEETVQLAHELNLKTVLWTLDTVDWKRPDPDWIVRKISSRLEPGALILMHPTESSSKALPELIRSVKNQGLTPGTVSELLSSKRLDKVESILRF